VAAPKETVWDLAPHTRAKHEILRRYLQAWTPILSLGGFPDIVYIDGFAGPGRYSKGEDGSPVIALRAALEQSIPSSTRLFFLFIERDPERAAVLQQIVDSIDRPSNFRVKVAQGRTFEAEATELLAFYSTRQKPLPPTFAFVDPFGWAGVPFSLLAEILKHPSCEVLVNFMYEEINRFLGQSAQPDNFDAFFGTSEWRDCRSGTPQQRNRCLHDLYVRQLRDSAGASYVRSFEMKNDAGVTDYYLFYATKSLKGLQKMKEAMWKVDSSGEFKFSDATDPDQMVMFGEMPVEILRNQILGRFSGREVTVQQVEEFVLAETAFRETHYKRQVLAALEKSTPSGLIAVNPRTGRRPGTYGDQGMRIRFT
jgi:three-Cys-motif partner protein